MNLQPLSEDQQQAAIEAQLKGNEFFDHLMAFSKIRKQHDILYRQEFTTHKPSQGAGEMTDLAYVESLRKPDLFKLQDGPLKGKFDPAMRQKGLGGDIVKINEGEPKSEYITKRSRSALFSGEGLDRLDAAKDAKGVELLAASADEKEDASLAMKLWLLVQKLRKDTPAGAEPPSAATLWPLIAARTDSMLANGEFCMTAFREVAMALLSAAGLGEDALNLGPLKDPVRIYEKAIDDYAKRFDDGELPEACVADVIRCRIVCDAGSKFRTVLSLLGGGGEKVDGEKVDGFSCEVDGDQATLRLIRCKNKFRDTDPTHFRSMNYSSNYNKY